MTKLTIEQIELIRRADLDLEFLEKYEITDENRRLLQVLRNITDFLKEAHDIPTN